MMRTPDGHSRLELSRFLAPPVVADHRNAPVNALGYLRVMFAVDDLADTLARLRKHGAQLVDEVVRYEDVYRLCYIRGPKDFSSDWPSKSADARHALASSRSSMSGKATALFVVVDSLPEVAQLSDQGFDGRVLVLLSRLPP